MGIESLDKLASKLFIESEFFIYKEQQLNINDVIQVRSRFLNKGKKITNHRIGVTFASYVLPVN